MPDKERIEYYNGYIGQVGRAIDEGADVRGYYAWTLLDNFEWAMGYSQRFGIVYCDFENEQKRFVKDSGFWYRDLIAAGEIEYDIAIVLEGLFVGRIRYALTPRVRGAPPADPRA